MILCDYDELEANNTVTVVREIYFLPDYNVTFQFNSVIDIKFYIFVTLIK